MHRSERVITLPNLGGGYSITLSADDSNTLVIKLVPEEDHYSYIDPVGEIGVNDSFDSGYSGWSRRNSRNTNDTNSGYYSLPIRKRSKADFADLHEGDRVLSINGKTVRNAARDVAMAYVDDVDDSLDLEIARTSSRSASPRNLDRQMKIQTTTEKQSAMGRRTSNGSLPSNNAVRKVTTTTTRIKTTKDGERLHETITKTVTEAMDDEAPTTVSHTHDQRDDLVGPVRKHSGSVEYTAPLKVDRGRRTSDVKISATQLPRGSANVTTTHSYQQNGTQSTANKPGTWQPPSQRNQPTYQQPQHQKTHQKPRFEMPKPTENPRYQAPGPKTDFAIFHHKPEKPKPRPSYARTPLAEKQPTYEPVAIQGKSKQGGKGGRELTITFAMPDQEPAVDFGSPPLSPSGMSVDSGVAPESPKSRKKHLAPEANGKGGKNILEDPSIILRSLAEDQEARPEKLIRPFSEPAGRIAPDEPEVSIVEKRRACKTIADLLMFPKNKQAKGARMFAKRRKRSARYTIEAIGQRDSDDESDGSSSDQQAAIITIKAAAAPMAVYTDGMVPPPPPIPAGGFTQRIKVEPTNFNVKLKSKDKCEHNVVTPKQCLVLADGLKLSGGKAAEMFELRRQRSEQYTLDETTMKEPKKPAPAPFKKPPGPQTKVDGKSQHKMSPWQAAEQSPIGCVSQAFPPKPKVKAPPPAQFKPKQPPPTAGKPGSKPGARYPSHQPQESIPLPAGSKLGKANFKDFNKKPRGWGSRSSEDHASGSLVSEQVLGRSQAKSLKYSGGYNDFNPKPRAFNSDSPRFGALSPTSSLAESEDL